MSSKSRLVGALPTGLVGLFAGLAAVAGSYAVAGFTPGFVAAPVSSFLALTMPDVVIRYAITVLGSLGQKLNLLTAIGIVVVAVGGVTVAGLVLGRRLNNRATPVVAAIGGAWGLTVALTGNVTLALGSGLPAGLVVLVAEVVTALPVGDSIARDRRQVLSSGATVVGIGIVGYILGTRRTPDAQSLGDDDGADSTGNDADTGTGQRSEREQFVAAAREQSLDVDGLEPLVSEEFYKVDINAVDPTVDESSWSLSVTGEVEEELTFDYDGLRDMESVDRFETLRCVGEGLNGQKMDTALWTGVPVGDIIDRANPQGDCECVMLRAADDYFEEFPLAALEGGLLAYGMNGQVLPRSHGYPVRALVPGHWGEINVKWLTEIEVLEREADGYWEQRGWHGTGPVTTVAKIHAVNQLGDGRREVGGHTYAGTRGIDTVEVSIDGGSTWNEADLSAPLTDITDTSGTGDAVDDVWRQWRYTYDAPGGSHEVVARAIDGTGELQPQEESDPFPSGPSGWVSRTVQ